MYEGKLLMIDEPGKIRASTGLPMVELWPSDARTAADLVNEVPGVRSVAVYGDRLHALVDGESIVDSIRLALSKEGIDLKGYRKRLPSLEDVFIAMVEGK